MADSQPSLLDCEGSGDARRVWSLALPLLAGKVSRMSYESYVVPIRPLRLVESTMELGVASPFAREWLEQRYGATIRSVLEAVVGHALDVVYRVVSSAEDDSTAMQPVPAPKPRRPVAKAQEARAAAELAAMHSTLCAQFDPNLSFETFVVGKTNRLAYSAAMAVADAPGAQFNPLFIYGPSGLGKTHLLHSIGQRILAANGSLRVLLIDGESFTHHYVNSLRDKSFETFRRYLRSVDVWLVDDIQTIAGREHTREEFFHTFNALQQSHRQIVLTSDKTPRELHAMDDRLRTRFESGLIADIAPPSLDTRIAILKQLCAAQRWEVPEDVLYFIADAIQSNVRALSGAVTRLVVQSSVLGVPMDMELARSVLTHFFIDKRAVLAKPAVSLQAVLEAVADAYALPAQALLSQRRDARTALARQVAMYLAKELTNESCKAIGAFLGGRDHTTVQRGAQKIADLLPYEDDLRRTVLLLRSRLCT